MNGSTDFTISVRENAINHQIVNISNEQHLSAIFKLNIDCFNAVFDWLPLNDLVAIGETCKHLQQIAGDFYQRNYGAKVTRESNGIYIAELRSNIFSEYIKKISISGDRLSAYQFVRANCTNSIKHFRVHSALPVEGFECVNEILKSVEILEMNECIVNGEFYDCCLKYCPNLKTISVTRSDRIRNKSIIIGADNEWLLRCYPNLVDFELTDCYGLEKNELKWFFEYNSHIRTFSADSRTLWENRHAILESNIKLETITVDIYQNKMVDERNQPISMVDCMYYLLNKLHQRKFYKRLHLYVIFVDQENIEKLLSLNGIEMINGSIRRIDRPLHDLKALCVWCDQTLNIDNLPNLERIYFLDMTVDLLWTVVSDWPKLKEIRIAKLQQGHFNRKLDLKALNKKRRRLVGARKIMIFLKEDEYLATKWTTKTNDITMIELKRLESSEWEELCARGKYHRSL